MGSIVEGALRRDIKDQTKTIERTNELLAEVLAELKHANELTRWQIEQQKTTV